MQREFRFQIAGFVPMNDVAFCQFVQHRRNFFQQFAPDGFVGGGTQFAHSVTSGAGVVSVAQAAFFCLTNPFDR